MQVPNLNAMRLSRFRLTCYECDSLPISSHCLTGFIGTDTCFPLAAVSSSIPDRLRLLIQVLKAFSQKKVCRLGSSEIPSAFISNYYTIFIIMFKDEEPKFYTKAPKCIRVKLSVVDSQNFSGYFRDFPLSLI